MAKPRAETVTRGSGNVFADLGLPHAEERQTKLRLAFAINCILEERGLTQVAAAARLGITRKKVSALARYQLDGFSVDRLIGLLATLDSELAASRRDWLAAAVKRSHRTTDAADVVIDAVECAKMPVARATRGDVRKALDILKRAGIDHPPMKGDELPRKRRS